MNKNNKNINNEYEAVSISYDEKDLNYIQPKTSIKNNLLNIIKNFFNEFIHYKKILKRNKIQIYNFFIIILLFISVYSYHRSLLGCYEKDPKDCLTLKYRFFFIKKFYELLISCLSANIIFFLYFKKKIDKIYPIILLIFLLYYFIFHIGTDLDEHGTYNSILFIILSILFLLFFQLIYTIIYIFINKNYKNLFLPILIIICLFSFILYFIIYPFYDCKKWGYGLSNSKVYGRESLIDNKCYIERPKKCYKNMLNRIFDLSKITFKNCKIQNGHQKRILLKYSKLLNKKSKNIGYPRTTINNSDIIISTNLEKYVFDEIYDLDNNNNSNIESEITLHFDEKNRGKININIKPNETLIKERKILYEKNKKNIKFNNVLILYIDALSREQFYRNLPETAKLLEKYYIKNTEKKSNFNVYQFLKYHNFNSWTEINAFPMFYGVKFKKYGDNFQNIYQEKGFITGQSNNFCSKEVYSISNKTDNLNYGIFDHELISLFCEPNYSNKYTLNLFQGPYSLFRRCLYGRDSFEYVLEFGEKFLDAYKNYPKLLKLGFNDAHEPTNEVLYYLDKPLKNFIQKYLENYFNDKSIIFIVSDHGHNMPGITEIFNADDERIEKTLGVLFLILPEIQNENELYNSTIIFNNEQKMVTPYDIYGTLMDCIGKFQATNYINSLFREIDGNERDCNFYESHFKENKLCHCINY